MASLTALTRGILLLSLVLHGTLVSGHMRIHPRPLPPRISLTLDNSNGTSGINTVHYFDQLIDHNNPDLGTFSQRYWFNPQYYEKDGPIILMTPGEENADDYTGYLSTGTVNGLIAQQEHGATVLIEHRFFGLSNPYQNLTGDSLAFLTIAQAVQDLAYFAEHVSLPMEGGDKVGPKEAPWILVGGSYSGALTAWTMVAAPDVFYAGYASSAVVEAITDFWAYFEPIRNYMPKNCSADVEAAIIQIDAVLTGSNQTAITELKASFGLQELEHSDDFVDALLYNLWDWQNLSPSSGPGQMFFEFCDALEVKDGKNAPASGWGAEWALPAWGNFWQNTYLNYTCTSNGEDVVECLGSYDANSSYYTNITVDNPGRSWTWMVCNEVGWYQDAPPMGHPAIVSSLVTAEYFERQCPLMFPDKFAPNTLSLPAVNATNKVYKGWNLHVDRLFFATGQRDPWRDATMSADNTSFPSTSMQPIVESDGFHCSDLIVENAVVDPTVQNVQTKALQYMKTWLAEWRKDNGTNSTVTAANAPTRQAYSAKFVESGMH